MAIRFALLLLLFASSAASSFAQTLDGFSRSLQELADRVSPTVVKIDVSGFAVSPEPDKGNVATVTRERATGSGVILSSDGLIITNAHVVEGAQKVTVTIRAERERQLHAKILGIDRQTDLAVLKVDYAGLPYLKPESEPVRQGQVVFAFGSPRGLANSMTMGIVSSASRQVFDEDPIEYIQTDTSINPGNSGGALVNAQGRLVGINTFIFSKSGGSEGLGFAIPARVLQHIYRQIVNNGRVRRGLIGISVQSLSDEIVEGLALPSDSGVLINDVSPGGPADRAGLMIGDIVISIDGVPLAAPRQLETYVYVSSAGQEIQLEIQRRERRFALNVVADERPEAKDKLPELANPSKDFVETLGVLVLNITDRIAEMLPRIRSIQGVVVAAHAPTLSSQPVDLEVGDVIHAVNVSPVDSVQTLRTSLRSIKVGGAVVLQIERNGLLRYLTFRME